MRKRNFKGRCIKRSVSKSQEVCRTYDAIQNAYLDALEADDDIVDVRCDVPLDGTEYMTDFLCTRANRELMVRECVCRRLLQKPMTVKLLDVSRVYWLRRGVTDWGLVIDAEE